MGKIRNFIQQIIPARFRVLFNNWSGAFFGGFGMTRYDFASLIWYNICDLLADILEDVQLTPGNMSAEGLQRFANFRAFMYEWGRSVLQVLWDEGFVVIAESPTGFELLSQNEYTRISDGKCTYIIASDLNKQAYVMRSPAYRLHGISDRTMCKPWLNFLDDICNSSATVNKRLGALVVASPKNLNNAPTATVLGKDAKKNLEEEFASDYGALKGQSNICFLPREMSWQTINLAGLDLRTLEKAKLCILAICDRLKAPANQVAIVDANSSKTLANGSELREGDRMKYASFRRVFERTFADMGRDLGISFTYTITGEPTAEANTGTQTV